MRDNVALLTGAEQVDAVPWPPFDLRAVDFLVEPSTEVLRSLDARRQEASAAFSFWCHRARLKALTARHTSPLPRLSRGLAFHLAPTNVPALFAYTLAVGLLAENTNAVHLSSQRVGGETPLLAVLRRVLEWPEHAAVRARTSLITYGRGDAATADYCARCGAQIVWDGDATVAVVRAMPMPSHAVRLYFPDHWSLAVFNQRTFSALTPERRGALTYRFYNDTYQMDQSACSGPQLVLWLEDGGDPACRGR